MNLAMHGRFHSFKGGFVPGDWDRIVQSHTHLTKITIAMSFDACKSEDALQLPHICKYSDS